MSRPLVASAADLAAIVALVVLGNLAFGLARVDGILFVFLVMSVARALDYVPGGRFNR